MTPLACITLFGDDTYIYIAIQNVHRTFIFYERDIFLSSSMCYKILNIIANLIHSIIYIFFVGIIILLVSFISSSFNHGEITYVFLTTFGLWGHICHRFFDKVDFIHSFTPHTNLIFLFFMYRAFQEKQK